jgi:hypothetical protein
MKYRTKSTIFVPERVLSSARFLVPSIAFPFFFKKKKRRRRDSRLEGLGMFFFFWFFTYLLSYPGRMFWGIFGGGGIRGGSKRTKREKKNI